MDVYTLGLWALAYLGIGAAAWLADRRWGVALRGWFIDLASPEPQGTQEGFLVGRERKAHLFWAGAVGVASAILLGTAGAGSLPGLLALVVGSPACFLGMQVGPLVGLGVRGAGLAHDKAVQLEASIRESAPQLVDRAVERGRELAQAVAERVGPDPDAPVPPTEAELRQQKIDRMDELLGKKKRDPQ